MRHENFKLFTLVSTVASALAGCGDLEPGPLTADTELRQSALTAAQRLQACQQDPRVVTGLVTAQVCAGADIFFRETFDGNGRKCGTCHPAENSTTIEAAFIENLHNTNPNDPLFVFESNPALANLEHGPSLFASGTILENVDGLEDPVNKFVLRSVPHVLSMATTITRDPGDLTTTNPPVDRTGWSGDGAPGDGSLRSFLTGAITQHYTKNLLRRPGTDFRLPTAQELDLVNTFQRSLGRLNELNLQQVNLFDAGANLGKEVFVDPARGRCNACHFNAGANFDLTGKNRNFDTRTRIATGGEVGFVDGNFFFDGGFGGPGVPHPNFAAREQGFFDSMGNGTFNTPSLIEAADTAPFFHNNQFATEIEDTALFYLGLFQQSPAAAELNARFNNTALAFTSQEADAIGRFLRALNVAFNLDIARQRARGALTLFNRFRDTRKDVQIKLLQLAENEIDDALAVLTSPRTTQPFYPVAVDRLSLAKAEIAAAIAAPASSRAGKISNAVSRIENARDQIGANVTFVLGQGNLMF
jgi:cytochrome c peroxidase